jgi:hypothetical protein
MGKIVRVKIRKETEQEDNGDVYCPEYTQAMKKLKAEKAAYYANKAAKRRINWFNKGIVCC